MIKRNRSAIIVFCLVSALLAIWILSSGVVDISVAGQPSICPQSCILSGKSSLEAGDPDKAVLYLTVAYNETPLLRDYILFWRAEALAAKSETAQALEDLAAIKTGFPDSPLIKKIRVRELGLLAKGDPGVYEAALGKYMEDYPSDNRIKYDYAVFLKKKGEETRARTMFREVFASVSPYAGQAAAQLSDADIRAADLLKKGKNLSKAWHFRDAERYFRKALKKNPGALKREINQGIADALFRQKRYKEAAAAYADCGDPVGRARSFYRIGDMKAFQKAMAAITKKKDPRVTNLLIDFGTKKRRAGDIDGAVSIFNDVMARYPAAKEEALWQKGWTFYRNGDYKKALDIFSSLSRSSGETRYLYWKNRAIEKSGSEEPEQNISHAPNSRNNNFYFLMSALRGKAEIPPFEKDGSTRCSGSAPTKRIELLEGLGLKKEAGAEIAYTAKKAADPQEMICLSSHLRDKGDFRRSVALADRIPFREELYDLYYPLAYFEVVSEAATANDLDPLLALSIMREESRYTTDARSPAGALGLMQLMPQTAARLSRKSGISYSGPEDLYDVKTNVSLGSYYLSALVKQFGSAPPAIASYNAGEERVKEWLAAGKYASMDEFIEDIPYNETRNYVKKVMTSYLEYMRQQGRTEMPELLIKEWNL
jgi:soluble lytic murein transglycosylase